MTNKLLSIYYRIREELTREKINRGLSTALAVLVTAIVTPFLLALLLPISFLMAGLIIIWVDGGLVGYLLIFLGITGELISIAKE